jgi:hypothetical protein
MPYVRSPVSEEKSVLQAAPQRLLQFTSENQCMSVVCRVFQVTESRPIRLFLVLANIQNLDNIFREKKGKF